MASSYVNDLRLNELATGDASGTWGDTTNTNLELIAEAFSYGTEGITTNADTHTTTIADGATDPGRSMYLEYTGTLDSTCTITIAPNTVSKLWIIENGTSGSQSIIIKQGSGATVTIPSGKTKVIYADGAGSGGKMVDAFASLTLQTSGIIETSASIQTALIEFTDGDDAMTIADGGGVTFAQTATFSDDIIIGNGKTIGSASDVDAMTIAANGQITLTQTLIGTALDIEGNIDVNGDIDVNGTSNLDVVDIDGAVNMATTLLVTGNVDFNGDLDVDGTTNLDVVDIDGAVNMATTLLVTGNVDFNGDLDVDGTTNLDVVDIDGAVDMATTLAVAGVLTAASLDISGNVDIDGTLETDALSINSTTVTSTAAELNILDGVTSTATELNLLDGVTSTTAELNILDGVTATAADINFIDGITNGTVIASKAIVTDANIDITGGRNITISGELDAATLDISGNADIDGTLEADAITIAGVTLAETISDTVGAMVTSNTESGITVAYQDADNTLDFTIGTLNQDTTGTAAIATTVTITDNESTNENNAIVFTAGGDLDGGNLGLESDGDLKYNPSTGTLSATNISVSGTLSTVDSVTMSANNAVIFEGATADAHETTLTVVDATADRTITLPNVSGTVPVLAAASNTQITSTPAELNILDGVTSTAAELNILDGVTSTAAELNILDGVTSTAAELNILDGVTSTAAELNILDGVTSTAAELNALDGITAVVGELNALDIGSTAVGTAVASKAVILDSNKDYTGLRNLTITGELDAATLDISGAIDVAGTANLDVVDIDGAVDMATTLTLAGNADFNGDLDVDGTTNLDVVDIDGAVDMATTLAVAGIATAATSANITEGALVDGTTAWDAAAKANATLVLEENTTISAPGNPVAGAIISIEVAQHASSGPYTLAWNTVFEFASSTTPVMTATDAKTDVYAFRYNGSVWQEIGRSQNMAQS